MTGLITARELARMHDSRKARKPASTRGRCGRGAALLLAVALLAAWVGWVVAVRPVVVGHSVTIGGKSSAVLCNRPEGCGQ